MNGVVQAVSVRVLETIELTAPLALRFWDPVTESPVRSGLTVSGALASAPKKIQYAVQGSTTGAFSFQQISAVNNGSGELLVTVVDNENRFLPVQFPIPLPSSFPAVPDCLPVFSPPGAAQWIPLFSSAARIPPTGVATLRADVWDDSLSRPAARAFFELQIERATYWAITDNKGKLAIFFPYPELNAFGSGILASPPHVSAASQTWPVTLSAFYRPALSLSPATDICAALAQPLAQLWAGTSLDAPLGSLTLKFGSDLIVRSVDDASGAPLSTLLLTSVASPLD